jgi:spermidine/putrescine transport system permease protein
MKTKLGSYFPFFIGIPAIIWQILFFYIPLLLILISSVVKTTEFGAFEAITFEKIKIFLQPLYLKVIGSSLLLALVNSLLCFLIGYRFAYFLAFKYKKYKNLMLFFLIVPFWTNFLLHAYAWFFVLEKHGLINNFLTQFGILSHPNSYLNSLFAIMVMMFYYYLPFMILPIYTSLEKFDYRLVEASLDLGASRMQTFRSIILPLSSGGIRAGFFLVFIPSFGEFAIPEIMGGDKWLFVGNVISLYILGEQTGAFGAAFTIVSVALLIISCLILFYLINLLLKPRATHG